MTGPRGLAGGISDRMAEIAREHELVRKGFVTAVDRTGPVWLATVNGREMPFIEESVVEGSAVLYVDQRDPLAFLSLDPLVKIWICTSLANGDTTWTSLDGDERTLSTRPARRTSLGGFVSEPTVSGDWQHIADDLTNLTGDITWTIDLTTNWQSGLAGDVSYMNTNDLNGVLAVVSPAWWDVGEPAHYAVTDFNDTGGDLDRIDLVGSSAGLTGYQRGQIRITYNTSTGFTEAELSSDVGETWVSQGTRTFAAGSFGAGFDMEYDSELDNTVPEFWDPVVFHGIELFEGAVRRLGFNFAELQSPIFAYTPDVRGGHPFLYGDGKIAETISLVDSDVAMAHLGAPLFLGNEPVESGPAPELAPPIFTDGEDLIDPAIACSELRDPGTITIITGVQPHDFKESTAGDNLFIWAVADRDGLDLDTNGWPDGYYPFGVTFQA